METGNQDYLKISRSFFKKYLENSVISSETLIFKSEYYLKNGEIIKALKSIDEAVELDSQNIEVYEKQLNIYGFVVETGLADVKMLPEFMAFYRNDSTIMTALDDLDIALSNEKVINIDNRISDYNKNRNELQKNIEALSNGI